MLQTLTIKRFKSIYESTLRFGRANLFIGANGAGKSNVLEALGVLSAALSRGLEPTILDSRGVRLSLPHVFKSSFKNTDLPKHFRLEAQFSHGRYECSIRSGPRRSFLEFHSEALFDGEKKVFGRGPNGLKVDTTLLDASVKDLKRVENSRSVWDIISPFCKISTGLRSDLEEFTQYTIYSPQTAVMRGLAIDTRVIEPLGLTGSGLASAFNDALHWQGRLSGEKRESFQKILNIIWAPGWADQVRVRGFDPAIVPPSVKGEGLLLYIRDKFMKTNRNFLSAFDASEGTLYLIFVAALLLHPDTPTTFALDNVDGTLNADLVRRLTDTLVHACTSESRMAGRKVYQTFVTSHHPSSLDSFDIFSSDQRIFVARRRDTDPALGSTYFEALVPPPDVSKSDWVTRKGGRNLSELLLENMIPGALR
ncbi:MAG TPA: AAA family ATPase [Allosphingosinicella sp.]|nr:AAA family ATPase [Allosphingosinicella sp.]